MAPPPEDPARVRAVHRAILSGLLCHVALRCAPNQYKAAGEKLLSLFPGSTLHRKHTAKNQPRWIMAAELVETSRLFARTAAPIDPLWILPLAPHLLHSSYSEPAWNPKAGRVLVLEKILLQGLEITRKHTDYGKINPEHATELFIRGALLSDETHIPLHFISLNRQTRQRVEESLTRLRHSHTLSLDESLYSFYAARIQKVSSIHDLFSLVQKKIPSDPHFCVLQESDLIHSGLPEYDKSLFPEKVTLHNTVLPVSYAYQPGGENDGATLRIPLPALSSLSEASLLWAIPGMRKQQVESLLNSLPRPLRKLLSPINPKIEEIVQTFDPKSGSFLETFAAFLRSKYKIPITPQDWRPDCIPRHLVPRVELVDRSLQTVAAGRDLKTLELAARERDHRSPAWIAAEKKWHRDHLAEWNFGDLPQTISIEKIAGVPLEAFTGLLADSGTVGIRLFRSAAEADSHSKAGVRLLVEKLLTKDIQSLERSFVAAALAPNPNLPRTATPKAPHAKSLAQLSIEKISPRTNGTASNQFATDCSQMILDAAFAWDPVQPLSQKRFESFLKQGREAIPRLHQRILECLQEIFSLRTDILQSKVRYAGIEHDLARLIPPTFPRNIPLLQFERIPRFLKAIQMRAQRAALRPAQDAQKAAQLEPFSNWEKKVPHSRTETFRWLLEEFRVSLFAQELGTAETVSAQKLQRLIDS